MKNLIFLPLLIICFICKAQLGLKSPIVSTNPITAKISYDKDGVVFGDIFKVTYLVENSDHTSRNKTVGYIKVKKTECKTCSDNYVGYSQDSGQGTIFRKIGVGTIQNGMTINKIKKHFLSYGISYGVENNSFYSGPAISISLMTGNTRYTLEGNYFDKLNSSFKLNNITKQLNSRGMTFSIRYEKPISLNYLEFSPYIGISGSLWLPKSVNFTNNVIDNYQISCTTYNGILGGRLALNIGPYFQLFSILNYSPIGLNTWEVSSINSSSNEDDIKNQLNQNYSTKNTSISFGFRIR